MREYPSDRMGKAKFLRESSLEEFVNVYPGKPAPEPYHQAASKAHQHSAEAWDNTIESSVGEYMMDPKSSAKMHDDAFQEHIVAADAAQQEYGESSPEYRSHVAMAKTHSKASGSLGKDEYPEEQSVNDIIKYHCDAVDAHVLSEMAKMRSEWAGLIHGPDSDKYHSETAEAHGLAVTHHKIAKESAEKIGGSYLHATNAHNAHISRHVGEFMSHDKYLHPEDYGEQLSEGIFDDDDTATDYGAYYGAAHEAHKATDVAYEQSWVADKMRESDTDASKTNAHRKATKLHARAADLHGLAAALSRKTTLGSATEHHLQMVDEHVDSGQWHDSQIGDFDLEEQAIQETVDLRVSREIKYHQAASEAHYASNLAGTSIAMPEDRKGWIHDRAFELHSNAAELAHSTYGEGHDSVLHHIAMMKVHAKASALRDMSQSVKWKIGEAKYHNISAMAHVMSEEALAATDLSYGVSSKETHTAATNAHNMAKDFHEHAAEQTSELGGLYKYAGKHHAYHESSHAKSTASHLERAGSEEYK